MLARACVRDKTKHRRDAARGGNAAWVQGPPVEGAFESEAQWLLSSKPGPFPSFGEFSDGPVESQVRSPPKAVGSKGVLRVGVRLSNMLTFPQLSCEQRVRPSGWDSGLGWGERPPSSAAFRAAAAPLCRQTREVQPLGFGNSELSAFALLTPELAFLPIHFPTRLPLPTPSFLKVQVKLPNEPEGC